MRIATLTDKTLPGVMRFLQIEWHNHERARNAWDIERAEMMAKIIKHEGETPMLKRQVEVLEKHIRMLELALKAERAKSRALAAGDKPAVEEEQTKDVKGKNAVKPDTKLTGKRGFLFAPLISGQVLIANVAF
jgi:striatin 1/3/4